MYMHELKEKLCEELEEIARKPEMGAGDLELVHKLTDTVKNIDKIVMLEEGDGYSRASYRGRKRDSMGRYSRDGRMGGYSRHDSKEAIMEQAQEMMDNATTERERDAIRRFMSELGRD